MAIWPCQDGRRAREVQSAAGLQTPYESRNTCAGAIRDARRARTAIAAAQRDDDVWLSLISVWEIAKKVEKHQLVLDRPLSDWLDVATAMPGLHLAELTRPILVDSCTLPPPFVGDPADQIIVATARHQGAVVVTRDREIRHYAHVRAVW
jgi:PIN domain nuclease of toxin-antitoxin system